MKKLIVAATLAATALGGAGYAVAQNPTPTATPKRFGADTDNNGTVSRAEMIAAAERRFAMLDTNKDGQVTRQERQAARQSLRGDHGGKRGHHGMRGGHGMRGPGMMIERLDTNKDGKVSRAEAGAPVERMFALADTNRDGFVDKAEAEAARGKMRDMRRSNRPAG